MQRESFLTGLPYWAQAIVLFLFVSVSAIMVTGAAVLILALSGQNSLQELLQEPSLSSGSINLMKWLQGLSLIGYFLIPSIVFAYGKDRQPGRYLKLEEKDTPFKYFLTFFIVIFSLPFMHFLLELNQSLNLPDSWTSLEDWMKKEEETREILTKALLEMNTFSDFLVNMLIIAIIPAISEEFFFRGGLQQLLREWFKNAHIAILVTAIIFSAIHIQFYGFLPRMVLGVLFGYLFYWSGSLWIPIAAHFFNNGLQVFIVYLNSIGVVDVDIENAESVPLPAVIVFTGLLIISIFIFKRKTETAGEDTTVNNF